MAASVDAVDDALRAVIRLVHVLGAVSWVGGGVFYLVVVKPSWSALGDIGAFAALRVEMTKRFRELTGTSIMVLVVTGVLITVDRVTDTRVSLLYGVVLAAKLLLVTFMYLIFRTMGDRKETARRRWATPELLLGIGVVVLFLTVVLRQIYEAALRSALG